MEDKFTHSIFGKRLSALFQPESLYPLVMVRVMFGAVMAGWALTMMFNGSLSELFSSNNFVFHYRGFDWIQPPGLTATYLIFGLIVVTSLMLGAGFYFKISSFVFTLAFSYITLIDKSNYLSYYYFVIIMSVMLMVSPAHRLFSLDLLRKPSIRVDYIPAWFMLAMKLQVVMVFFFAGMGKLNYDWLFEGRPVSIWLMAAFQDMGISLDLTGKFKGFAVFISWVLILSDFIFPHFLLDRKTASWAFRLFLLMELISIALFPVGFFPILFCVSCIIFLPPERIHEFISRVSYFLYDIFQFKGEVFKPGGGYLLQYRHKRLAMILVGAFLAFQVSWPVVAYLKWGALKWADTVFHFSWNMELYEKQGQVQFFQLDTRSGQESGIPLDLYLTAHQQKIMSQDPRLILQFAHYLEKVMPKQVEIRAELKLSMNGHQPLLIVEKTKNLFSQLEAYKSGIAVK